MQKPWTHKKAAPANNAVLNKFLDHKYFNYQFVQEETGEIFKTTGPWSPEDRSNGPSKLAIELHQPESDKFANGTDNTINYAFVVVSIFHEFVHVKQDMGLDGFKKKSYVEDEFEAYYQESQNKNLPQLTILNKNLEFAWKPIFKLYADPRRAELVKTYSTQINQMLNSVPVGTATNVRKSVLKRTGVQL